MGNLVKNILIGILFVVGCVISMYMQCGFMADTAKATVKGENPFVYKPEQKIPDIAAKELSMLENKYRLPAMKLYSDFVKDFSKYRDEASKHNTNPATKNKLDNEMRAKCQNYIKQINALIDELRPIKFSAYVEDAAFACYAFMGDIESEIANIDDILSYHAPTDSEAYFLAQTLHENAVGSSYYMENKISLVKTGKSTYQINPDSFAKVRNNMTSFELINLFKAPCNTTADFDEDHEIMVWETDNYRYDITLKDGVVARKESKDKHYIDLSKTINSRIKSTMKNESGDKLNSEYLKEDKVAAADDKIKNALIYEAKFYTKTLDDEDKKQSKKAMENNIKLANAIAKWAPEYGLRAVDALKYLFGDKDAEVLIHRYSK